MGTFTNSEAPDEMQHFIRVYTVCLCKTDLQTKEYNTFLSYNLTPLDLYNGISQVDHIKQEGRIHCYTKG